MAFLLAGEFMDVFVRYVPFWGGIIRGADARGWIERARGEWAAGGINLSLATLTERYPLMPNGRPARAAVRLARDAAELRQLERPDS
jgi:hypothetical protein